MKVLFLLLPLGACAPSLVDDADLGSEGDTVTDEPAEPVDTVQEALEDGSFRLLLDATHETLPVKLDLDTRYTTLDTDWEFSMVRYDVLVNEGIGVMAFEGVPFDELVTWSDDDWAMGDDASSALAMWWEYNLDTHELSTADITYLFQTDEGAVFKMRFDDYYASAGTPATVSLWLAEVVKEDEAAE